MLKVEKKSDGWYVGGERYASQAEATRRLIALLMAPARAAPKPSRVAAPRVVTPPPPPPKPSRVVAPAPSPLARKEGKWEVLNTRDGGIRAMEHFLPPKEATASFATLKTEIDWRQDYLKMYGRDIPVPRLQQAYGDRGVTYTYSKITMPALPWTPTLAALRDKVEAVTGVRPNFVLCNYYRTGSDSVSWHADDEKELGPNPFISSVSLGAERDFLLKHRSGEQVTVRLVSGSLLVMDGPLQTFWQHSIPKTKSPVGGRINLTFRVVGGSSGAAPKPSRVAAPRVVTPPPPPPKPSRVAPRGKIVGFTGTRAGMTAEQIAKVSKIFREAMPFTFVHGDCIGADTDAHHLALKAGAEVIMRPCTLTKQRSFSEGAEKVYPPKPPLDRNREIVDDSTLMVATPKGFSEEGSGGTWYTIRYARNMKKPLIIVWPDGSTGR